MAHGGEHIGDRGLELVSVSTRGAASIERKTGGEETDENWPAPPIVRVRSAARSKRGRSGGQMHARAAVGGLAAVPAATVAALAR